MSRRFAFGHRVVIALTVPAMLSLLVLVVGASVAFLKFFDKVAQSF